MSDAGKCKVDGCEGTSYKNSYCVEHFVKFGENAAAGGDAAASSSTLAAPAAAASQPSPTAASPSADASAAPKKKFAFGGGGVPCTVCSKTCYPAETMQFEMKPYHIDCFKCSKCVKSLDATQASLFEGTIYCKMCFQREGLHIKQREVKWSGGTTPTAASASSTAPKFGGGGTPCAKCNKTVYAGETMSFEGRVYHPKCLTCTDCNKECTLNELGQFENNLYCRRCWDKGGFAAKQRNVAQNWESDHPPSAERRNSQSKANPIASKFGGGGNPCTKCGKTVYAGETISFEGLIYHPKCLTCTDCSKECTVNDANKYENQLYCKRCWEKGGFAAKQRDVKWDAAKAASASSSSSSASSKFGGGGNPCTSCGKTVYAGEAVQYEGKMYHPKCVVCQECNKECTVNNVNQFESKLYCSMCWQKGGYAAKQRGTAAVANAAAGGAEKPKAAANPRFANLGGGGLKCYVCTKTVYPAETLQYESRPYHAKCFKCTHCSKEILQVAQAEHKGDKIYCNKCFMELGLWQATLN